MLVCLALLIKLCISSDILQLDHPFLVEANDTISYLYRAINTKMSYETKSRGISVIFGGKLILNLFNDHRTIHDIGMNNASNRIVIIQKPVFPALLEMMSDINNQKNIPWIERAEHCLSNPFTNQFHHLSTLGRGIHCNDNGALIAMDLSHLNLTGNIHLESLPQTVRSLDLSFNDLDILNLTALCGKSLEKLNVENNRRCHINTECFSAELGCIWSIRELRVSSNQIFPWIIDPIDKAKRIKNWMNRQYNLVEIIVDGERTYRRRTLQRTMRLHSGMLRVIEGVTNKKLIPWYRLFHDGCAIQADQWRNYGVSRRRKIFGIPSSYKFNLCSLGLQGHIDLGSLPENVIKMDLSNNNLSSIFFVGDGPFNLRVLDVRNNDNLRIDLMQIYPSSTGCCLCGLVRLSLSSNQLEISGVLNGVQMGTIDFVGSWLRTTKLREVVIDDIVLVN